MMMYTNWGGKNGKCSTVKKEPKNTKKIQMETTPRSLYLVS